MTSKSLSEGSLRNSSLAQAQPAIRVSCAGVNRATSESGSGGRPARFSGATRFGLAFVTTVGATHVALWVRQQAIEQYASRHLGQLYFAAGVAQTAQGRSGRGIVSRLRCRRAPGGALAAVEEALGPVTRQRGEAVPRRALSQCCGHGELVLKCLARISASIARQPTVNWVR